MLHARSLSLEEVNMMHDNLVRTLGGSLGIWEPNVLHYALEAQLSPYYDIAMQTPLSILSEISARSA